MFARILVGSLLAAVLMFVWGFVFWTIYLPTTDALQGVTDEDLLAELEAKLVETGTYRVPWVSAERLEADPEGATADFVALHKQGPLARIYYRQSGVDPMAPKMFVYGGVHYFGSAVLVGLLLAMAAPAVRSFFLRWAFVIVAGLFAALFVELRDPIWAAFPWWFPLHAAAYDAASWLIAGLPLALLVRAKAPPTAASAQGR